MESVKQEISLKNCDCIEGMTELGPWSVDHIITDPPYDAETHENARSMKDGGSNIDIDFKPLQNMIHVDYFMQLARRWSIAFCSLEQLGDYRRAARAGWIRAGLWVRTNGTPALTGDRPGQGGEGIAIMHPHKDRRWNGKGQRGYWLGPISEDHEHPTQKPLWIMETLIRQFTDRGETILDPFMGSGTTGVAAVKLGRNFIGFERDPKYFAIAERRIKAAHEQAELPFERTAPTGKQQGLF
jgi:site-specific DNA-methyltransferase (adenine-specific)